jgi:hypothetical protein
MPTYNITCSGPGPHSPASGILGTSDRPPTADVRCGATACIKPTDPTITNRDDLTTKATSALTANATYLAITSPSNAQVSAQVTKLTRQMDGVIRLLLNQLDDTSGT